MQISAARPLTWNRAVSGAAQVRQASREAHVFTDHISSAIQGNRDRKSLYAQMSQGKSKRLSNLLIASELVTLPFAKLYDRRAEAFNAQGIPIIDNDFVSMKGTKPTTTPPRYRNVASEEAFRQLDEGIDQYQSELYALLKKRDFTAAAALSYDFLRSVECLEEEQQSHFAMAKHMAESVGFAALHAIDYYKQSGGETDELSAKFIKLQARGLSYISGIDRRAQELHRTGIGIVVNDVPDIPFKQEWEKRMSAK